MNILLASHGFPPTHSAGAERRTERMAKWLTAQGHHVVVFTVEQVNSATQKVEHTEQDGFEVYRLYYDLKEFGPQGVFRNLYNNPFIAKVLRNLLRGQSFDLVHMVSGYLLGVSAIEVVKEFGLPLVITLTEFWFMCARLNLIQLTGVLCSGPESPQKCARCLLEDKRRYRLPAQNMPMVMDALWRVGHHIGFGAETERGVLERQQALKTALARADLVICPSAFLIEKFRAFDYDIGRFVHIRQGMSPASFNQTLPPKVHSDALRITYVGQLKYHKGVDLLIDAVMHLLDRGANIQLNIWGNEHESREYVQHLKRRSMLYPAIHWNGAFTGGHVWGILAETDVLVVPSRWYENSPNAILEAFLMRVPVVATDLGGMAELVTNDENGLLFKLDNTNELIHQLSRLLNEPDLLATLAARIPQIKTLDQEMVDVMRHYDQLLPNKV